MDEAFFIEIKETLIGFLWSIGPTFLKALVALIIGLFIIKFLKRIIKRLLRKANTELSLKTFVESLTSLVLYGLLFAVIGIILGIKTTSFIALFGGAAIAVGLALQGSLANFAGGVLILVFKPFRVGDLIHVNDTLGYVEKVDILYTRLKTFDGRMITMPNGNVANSDVDNRTMNDTRRVDLTIRVSLNEDIDKVRSIISEALQVHPGVLKYPEPDIWLDDIEEYNMKITARSWVKSDEYWPMHWIQLENVKKALDAHGIVIPIPKREISYAVNKENSKI
ncbi:mechanosensitive ion channel family protein [Brumimicrobium mesophilum]|uniref:mechanosensitive ion channel family protein n=1 Tax=Brumimicrobium mesophilum TaxID=392717 RepID=UPI000D140C3B|nr:mechanosensitive ion channel domain-containing protein [Brumimicrobium mesophilum]